MKKFKFPKWSPPELVEIHDQKKNSIESSRQMYAAMDHDDLMESGYERWKKEVIVEEKVINLLYRLLTDQNMEPVWSIISTLPSSVSNRLKIDPAFSLWVTITKALENFNVFISFKMTPAQKIKNLQFISSQTKSLLKAILKDPFARAISKNTVSYYLSRKNIEWRESAGEITSIYEYQVPLTLSSDCNEAWDTVKREATTYDIKYSGTENYRWRERPLLARLRDWSLRAEELDIVNLLEFFNQWVEHQAQHPFEIKHPGRGQSALRPFLIRRLHGHMQWYYGKPLDEAVAQIVTTVLDLSTPLTRDDIRPYIVDDGKNLDLSS